MGESAKRITGTGEQANSVVSPRLVSLAILKANWNKGHSYLDSFVPFVAECLRTAGGPVSVADVQMSLRKTFGMRVPQHTLGTILHRATREDLVHRSDGLYYPNAAKLAERVLTPDRSELVRCYDALIGQMITFAKERYERTLTPKEATDALDGYVTEFGASTVLKGVAADVVFEPKVVAGREDEFIVHAFVEHLSETDPPSFGYFQTIVEGSMLASVVYLPEPGSVERKFRDSTVYLDTPFLLNLLGYQGEELAAPATELVQLLQELGARLACFDRTLAEVRGVLQGAQLYGTGRSTAVSEYFRTKSLRRSDVDLIIVGLPEALGAHNIRVVSAPGYSEKTAVDEVAFKEILERTVRYANEGTMQHDLDAIVAVHRLRGGRAQGILEESKAIFLTTNTKLVAASREFFRLEDDGFSWPQAITDRVLATLVWLKKPMRAPDLPRKQIMADCYAALRPNPVLWSQWLHEIEQVAKSGSYSDAQLDIMRYSPEAQRALMDKTFGDPSAVDDRTVGEVLAAAESTITAPVFDELNVERSRREEAEAEAERRRIAHDAAVAAVEEQTTMRHARLRVIADRRARLVGRGVLILLVCVLVLGALAAASGWGAFPGPAVSLWLRIPALILAAASGLVAVAGAGWGWNIAAFAKRVEASVAPRLHRRSLRKLGEEL